jgi:hypothetical protein
LLCLFSPFSNTFVGSHMFRYLTAPESKNWGANRLQASLQPIVTPSI